MQLSIKKLQAAMLAVLGPASSELLEATSHHGINAENAQAMLADVVSEIKAFLKTLPIPDTIPEQENTGLYGLQRLIYVNGEVILNDAEIGEVEKCFALDLTNPTPVPPFAVHTMAFNTETLLDKTLTMISDVTGDTEQSYITHVHHHIARLISYLHVLDAYSHHCAGRNYDQHVAVTEALEETRSELLTEMENVEEEQMMLYEGVECLLAGREPSTQGELYTKGILTANSVYNVFGGEAWYDGIMNAINKVIEKIKQGWEWFVGLFKGDKAPEETIKKAEEAAKEELENLSKAGAEVEANDEKINKLVAALESLKFKNAALKKHCDELITKTKGLVGKKGAELVNKFKTVFADVKTFYGEYAKQSSLFQKGKEKLDSLVKSLNKLRGLKQEDKEAVAQERSTVQQELNEAKELQKEASDTVKEFERVGNPFILMMTHPSSFTVR